MKKAEFLSRILILTAVLGIVGVSLLLWRRTPLVHARVAEEGGWSPDVIRAEAGKPLTLRLTSDDVVHGFAIGQMDMEAVDIQPGQVTDVRLLFDRPGIYTFYCTRWCGINHWRMRGTIEVSGPEDVPSPASPPLYVTLGLDLDAPHEAAAIPSGQPSAMNGRQLAAGLPIDLSADYYRARSPYQAFEDLRKYPSLSEAQRWDVVAHIWQANTTSESITAGRQLYARNCAACHGEGGAGDGVFADDLAEAGGNSTQEMTGADEMMRQTPVDFTDPWHMLGASPALLQGKILRGGMGTSMPMWGSIFTEEQVWDLVAYLYTFQFTTHE